MEHFFGASPPDPPLSAFSSLIEPYLVPLQPYARPVVAFLAPLVPPFLNALQITIQLLTPLFHTLHLLFLSASSLALTALLKLLYALPPSLTPLVILVGLLFGLYIVFAIMSLVRRATAFLFGVMFRLGLLGALIGVAWYVSERGIDESLKDLGWGYGVLRGWWEEGKELGDGRARAWERGAFGRDWAYQTQRGRGGW